MKTNANTDTNEIIGYWLSRPVTQLEAVEMAEALWNYCYGDPAEIDERNHYIHLDDDGHYEIWTENTMKTVKDGKTISAPLISLRPEAVDLSAGSAEDWKDYLQGEKGSGVAELVEEIEDALDGETPCEPRAMCAIGELIDEALA